MIKAVLFDLDGTLADSAPDLGAALNALLLEQGKAPHDYASIRPVTSHGARGLIRLGFGIDDADAEFAVLRARFFELYHKSPYQNTVLFDGIVEMLNQISQRNLIWGIVTNKPAVFTDLLLPNLAFPKFPAVVVSGDTTAAAKPDPLPILYAAKQINIAPENCIYVGDAERDIRAGRNAGMKTVLANWGYIDVSENPHEWGADISINHPLDLLDYLN